MHHLDKNIGYEIWSIEKKRGLPDFSTIPQQEGYVVTLEL
jgi:hypothetical protein